MVLDGNIGMNKQNQYRARAATSARTSERNVRASPGRTVRIRCRAACHTFDPGIARLATTTRGSPARASRDQLHGDVEPDPLMGAHEMRAGFDFIRYQLNHWQPELGRGPRGDFSFSGNITGQPGYTSNLWNQYAGFLLGLDTGYGKSVQFETMTRPREPVRHVRQRPLERRCEDDGEPRLALRVLPADVARASRHRAARLRRRSTC